MATTNFKLFDENKTNLLSDTEYANATQRLNGVQTGVASSQLNNKFAYQVSLVAYAIAQLMNANNLDANDTMAVSVFVGNLQGSILQKVADMASTAEAVAGVLTNKYISPATMKAAALLLSGGVMNGVLDMNGNRITNLPTPTADSDPATKGYVDGLEDSKWILIDNKKGTYQTTTTTNFNIIDDDSYLNYTKVRISGTITLNNCRNTINYIMLACTFGVLLGVSRYEFKSVSNVKVDLIWPINIFKVFTSSGSVLAYNTGSYSLNSYTMLSDGIKINVGTEQGDLTFDLNLYFS